MAAPPVASGNARRSKHGISDRPRLTGRGSETVIRRGIAPSLGHPIRLSPRVRVVRSGYRTQFRPADLVIAPSSGQQIRLSHPVPASRSGYRTQFPSADPDIAPSSRQPIRILHPVPVSRSGYRTQFRPADPDIAPSSGQQIRILHPVPASRSGYCTQFGLAHRFIAPSSPGSTRLTGAWYTPGSRPRGEPPPKSGSFPPPACGGLCRPPPGELAGGRRSLAAGAIWTGGVPVPGCASSRSANRAPLSSRRSADRGPAHSGTSVSVHSVGPARKGVARPSSQSWWPDR